MTISNEEKTSVEFDDGAIYRSILESIGRGYCTIEVAFDEDEEPTDYRFLKVNSSFARLTGIKNGAGRWMREIAPDQDQSWFEIYGRVARTGVPERFEDYSTPLDRWFSVSAFKIEGPQTIAVVFDDITDRKRAEAAVRTSQGQFQALFDQAPIGIYLVDSDCVIQKVNPLALPVFGDIPDGPVGLDFDEVLHIIWDKQYADEVVGIFRHVLVTGKSYFTPERAEYRADRNIIEYYEWRADRILLSDNRFGVVFYFRDVSSQVNARKEIEAQREAALKSEKRYRTLFEAIDSGFCIIDVIFDDENHATDYRFIEANPAFKRQSGLVDAVGHRISEFTPDIEPHWFERYGHVALTGEPLRIEGEVAPLGRWFDINAFRVGLPEQRRIAVLFNDISDRCQTERELRESEGRQRLLLAELQHRVRNILAMIQSVIRQSLRPGQNAEDYANHISGRIAAMARTQVLLTRSVDRKVDLEDAVRDELLDAVGPEGRFRCVGPDVALPPKAAEVLTLAIHELATNSLKYGAFSDIPGNVAIRWAIETRDEEEWLCFEWEETEVRHSGFGPDGFGTELITRRVPYELKGTGSLTPSDQGMLTRIEFPLRNTSSVLETGMQEIAQ